MSIMATSKLLCQVFGNKLKLAGASSQNAVRCMCTGKAVITRGSTEATHTGQKWDEDDYRNARFVNTTRYVNQNFSIDLINEATPMASKQRVVSCDGGGGPTGHPKVYINLDKPGNHICGYCGLRFYLDHHH